MKGRLITTLIDSYKQAGEYKAYWDNKRFGSGVYFLRLSVNGSAVSRKVVVTWVERFSVQGSGLTSLF